MDKGCSCLHAWMLDPLDAVLWCTSGNSCITYYNGSSLGALLCTWVESEDDRVPGLETDEGLEYDS